MLPIEENITHGTWRIEGNQYSSTVATEPPETTQYTIILIICIYRPDKCLL